MKNMTIKLFLLPIIFVIVSMASYGQENEWARHQVKLNPLRTFNWFSPGLEANYEIGYGRFATQLSGAYFIDIINIVPRASDLGGYRVNLEQKCYLKTFSNRMRNYMSVEVSYNHINMVVNSEFIPHDYLDESWEEQEANVYWGDFEVNRNFVIGNVKYGMLFSATSRLVIDVSFGIGLIHQNVNYPNKRHPNDKHTRTVSEDIITPFFYKEGKYFVFNIPTSVKIGVAF